MSTFWLTPRRIPAERKASIAKREVDQDMVAREESVSKLGSDADRQMTSATLISDGALIGCCWSSLIG